MCKYYTTKEAAELLYTSPRRIADWRQSGILKAVRTGKGFVYREDWIDECMTEWIGYDLSSNESVKHSILTKKAEEKSAPIHHDRERRRPF